MDLNELFGSEINELKHHAKVSLSLRLKSAYFKNNDQKL